MRKKTKEIVVHKERPVLPQGNSPADIIRMAVAGKADLSQMEKFMELQERHENRLAKQAYSKAFAEAQALIQAVTKKKFNPQTHSKYAGLDSVIDSSKPIYTEAGFAVIFYEGVTPIAEHIRICADVLHKAGHKESYFYDVPMDGYGIKGNANMTKIHAKASSTSYGRRYLMCMIWNIPTHDDDGNTASKPVVAPSTAREPEIVDAPLKPENECHGCGEIVSDTVKAYSTKKFNACLCLKCQKNPPART